MTHPGKEALELLSINIDKMWQPLPCVTLEKINAYVEELERAVESAMGHANRFHEALEATRDCRNAALEEAAKVAGDHSMRAAFAIRKMKGQYDDT